MIFVIAFIITSILQYYFYRRNFTQEKGINDLVITLIVLLFYFLAIPFLGYIFLEKHNHYKMPYILQSFIIGSIGVIFTLITYFFWYLEKRKLERNS